MFNELASDWAVNWFFLLRSGTSSLFESRRNFIHHVQAKVLVKAEAEIINVVSIEGWATKNVTGDGSSEVISVVTEDVDTVEQISIVLLLGKCLLLVVVLSVLGTI